MIFPWTGSAKTLRGDCKVICVFSSDEQSKVWSEKKKDKVKEDVNNAWNWIVEKAAEYDVEINPQTEFLNEEEDVTFEFIPDADSEEGNIVDPFESMIQQLGYETTTDFYEAVKEEGVNTHFIFFVNKDGRSYQSNLNIYHRDCNLEINVVFWCGVGTIIHETLHAYGAIDLYNVNDTPEQQKVVDYVEENYPNEVMLHSSDKLDTLVLSPFNAFMVGWHRDYDDSYFNFVTEESSSWLQEMIDNIESFDEDGNLVIDSMEEVSVYVSEEGVEFHRYKINGTESIYLWREFGPDDDKEGEGIQYKELFLYNEDSTYRLMGLEKPDIIDVPLEGGMVQVMRDKEGFKEYYYVTLSEDSEES